jgi:type IV secretion system protein VirD4
MTSGLHPVRAQKVRYYEDPQLQSRILKPSHVAPMAGTKRPDEWSGHAPIVPSARVRTAQKAKARDESGGLRRQPELPLQEDVVVKAPLAENEFDAVLDEDDAYATQATAFSRSTQSLARAVSLDPHDNMDL